VKLGVIADLHWRVAPEAPARWHADYDFGGLARRCAATVEALAASGCELLVVAGDLTHDGDRASREAALDCILGASPIPVAVVEGNHDVHAEPSPLADRADVRDGWARARALAGEELIALGALRAGAGDGDGDGGGWGWDGAAAVGGAAWGDAPGPSAAGRSPDGAPSSAADGLASVVVSHFPLAPHAGRLASAGLPCPGELAGRAPRLRQLAATGVPTVVLSGHVHVRDAIGCDTVLQICVPALVEPPHEAAIVDVDPLAHTVRCMRVRGDERAADRGAEPWLLAAADERWTFAEGAWSCVELAVTRRRVLAEA
jgi:calcineurin-like phosphoesterase family protein